MIQNLVTIYIIYTSYRVIKGTVEVLQDGFVIVEPVVRPVKNYLYPPTEKE